MNLWVAAFVGESAEENYEITTATGNFWVSSPRTPIRRAAPGDRALLYMSGKGFIGEATVRSPARTPYGEVPWAGKPPRYGLSLGKLALFDAPILYRFPGSGGHPVLGFHRYSLTGGFLSISEDGFYDVLGWAGREASPEPAARPVASAVPAVPPAWSAAEPTAEPAPVADLRDHRTAGQHASKEGRRRAALWTVAEMGAAAIGWKGAEERARDKAQEAEKTWVAGGRAEEKVGVELQALRRHGFYLFHDVPLNGLGNVDHVCLGPHGFFGIETKGHKGQVTARGGELLLNGRPPRGNFISQTWRGCYKLKEILGAPGVTPLLCFTDAFVSGRLCIRGVRVLPLQWLVDEILTHETYYSPGEVANAAATLSHTTGYAPSTVPHLKP